MLIRTSRRTMIRDIVERPTATPSTRPSAPTPPTAPAQSTGFPVATHRSKSAFARRAHAGSGVILGRAVDAVPSVSAGPSALAAQPARPGEAQHARPDEAAAARAEVDAENAARVRAMSTEEREEEVRELTERFGAGLGETMRRVRAAREARERIEAGAGGGGTVEAGAPGPPAAPAHGTDGTRPDARAILGQVDESNRRKVEGMSPDEREGELRELEARFGGALLGRLKEAAGRRSHTLDAEPTAATTGVVSEAAKLEWTRDADPSPSDGVRFNLSGQALSADASIALPAHLGLHHHGAAPGLAGYTPGELLHLARSTVVGQRTLALGVLAKICRASHTGELDGAAAGACAEAGVLEHARTLAVEAVGARNVGIVRAGIELLYEALGGSAWAWLDADGDGPAPFRVEADFDAVDFDALAPRLYDAVELGLVPPHSLEQVARLLRRVARSEQHTVATPFVPALLRSGSREALHLARDVAVSSRAAAEALAKQGTWDGLLRHIVGAADDAAAARVALQTYTALARYGMCASLALAARDAWIALLAGLEESGLVAPALDLLAAWTTCAIDPHRTTPEHDLTWAQIAGLKWADDALAVLDRTLGVAGRERAAAAAARLLVAWLEGSAVNGVRHGEDERAAVHARLEAMDIASRLPRSVADIPSTPAFVELATALFRLHALVPCLDDTTVERYTFYFAATTSTRPADRDLRYAILSAARRRPGAIMNTQQWASSAFDLLLSLEPGDEPAALALVDDVLQLEHEDVGHKDGLVILRPLLHHAILPDVEEIVGPRTPSHLYLKATATLRPPPPALGPHAGLPLGADWTWQPLNELLNSSGSQALAQAPRDWAPSETELTRATLALVLVQQAAAPVERAHAVLGAMKVFMLEHGQSGAATEVFRDAAVARLLALVLAPTRIDRPDAVVATAPLEAAAANFTSAPFFQFYTDLVALYAAVSFGDALFSRVLVAPLAMSYAIDYRRLVWCDSAAILRSIRVAPGDVPRETTLAQYFSPAETDGDVLRAMARALAAGWLGAAADGRFLWRLAVGHLARLWWDTADTARESARVGTMVAIVGGGGDDAVRALLREGDVGDDVVRARKGVVGAVLGDKGAARVAPL